MKSDMCGGPYIPNEVGRNLYAWTGLKGKPSHTKCAISAHGNEALINNEAERKKLPNGVTLVYYGPHGLMLNPTNLYEVVTGLVDYNEKVTTTNSTQDYGLAKSQDAHQGSAGKKEEKRGIDEGYKFIGHQMHFMQMYDSRLPPQFKAEVADRRDNYRREIGMDVVTIRSRKVRSGPMDRLLSEITLWQVINLLWENGYPYKEIHCVFCRGTGGDNWKKHWNPSDNPAG